MLFLSRSNESYPILFFSKPCFPEAPHFCCFQVNWRTCHKYILFLFKQKMLLSIFRISKNEQETSHRWHMRHGTLAVTHVLLSKMLCLTTFDFSQKHWIAQKCAFKTILVSPQFCRDISLTSNSSLCSVMVEERYLYSLASK